jgi:hypothetical protein
MLQTEFEFTLPKGYVDADGNLQKDGVMRLATAADEVLPLKDPRVQSNPAYLTIILFSRVIVRLGGLDGGRINPKIIEGFFVEDLAYLQDFYAKVNGDGTARFTVACPKCEHKFEAEPEPPEGP